MTPVTLWDKRCFVDIYLHSILIFAVGEYVKLLHYVLEPDQLSSEAICSESAMFAIGLSNGRNLSMKWRYLLNTWKSKMGVQSLFLFSRCKMKWTEPCQSRYEVCGCTDRKSSRSAWENAQIFDLWLNFYHLHPKCRVSCADPGILSGGVQVSLTKKALLFFFFFFFSPQLI